MESVAPASRDLGECWQWSSAAQEPRANLSQLWTVLSADYVEATVNLEGVQAEDLCAQARHRHSNLSDPTTPLARTPSRGSKEARELRIRFLLTAGTVQRGESAGASSVSGEFPAKMGPALRQEARRALVHRSWGTDTPGPEGP